MGNLLWGKGSAKISDYHAPYNQLLLIRSLACVLCAVPRLERVRAVQAVEFIWGQFT